MGTIELLRADALALPNLAKFAVAMAIVVGIPPLSRRVGLPAVVGLLLVGVVAGPHCLGLFGENRPIGDLFADLGKLLLMFFAGLEMDLALFQRTRHKAITLGFASAVIPMVLGTVLCLCLGYEPIPVIVVGSLLGSHTLLASPIVNALGVNRLEPVAIAVGATLFSDSLSLIIFAICVSTYKSGFSISAVALQIIELIVFVPLIFFTLSRAGAFVLGKAQDQEDAYFILMLGIMALAGVLAETINLPGIVGAFLAGLSVNAAVRDQPAKTKVEVLWRLLFHSNLLHGNRIFDRSTGVCSKRPGQFLPGRRNHRCRCSRQVDCRRDREPCVRLHSRGMFDNLVANIATGRRNPRCHPGRF